ncbi:MAG: hypothetical protein Q8Q23_05500 [bacterium]|nr:hypothetical protein [bacterium]
MKKKKKKDDGGALLLTTAFILVAVTFIVFFMAYTVDLPTASSKTAPQAHCATIQDGTLLTSDGAIITTGYDKWGYNYQSRMFNGTYCDAYRDAAWCQPYKYDELIMKWNDAWLDNKDCDGDDLLDRHYGYSGYIGSGALLTNNQSGTYVDDNGKEQSWNYFVKIVAVPEGSLPGAGNTWLTPKGKLIGPSIWGSFAIIQEIYNDTGTGDHGEQFISPVGPGFGKFKP